MDKNTSANRMNNEVQKIRFFLYSQAFADGFRITIGILIPAVIASLLGHFDIGLTISLGPMCVSMTDTPGPYIHKRNGMLFCCVFMFLVSLITVYARLNVFTMGLEIALVCFFFSMFNVYGNRAASVANGVMLIMIFTMDKDIPPSHALVNSLYITAGGFFYMGMTLLLYKLRPYRVAQRALGESIKEVAGYLSIKADFYNPLTDLDTDYKKLLAQQIVVNDKQDFVRELLFKTRQIVNETTTAGRKLVLAFVETVDLFEAITASYYDYNQIRKQFSGVGILEKISSLIKRMAEELNNMSLAIQANQEYAVTIDFDNEIQALKEEIDRLGDSHGSNLVLKKVLVNMRRLHQGLTDVHQYFEGKKSGTPGNELDHSMFISHQSLDPDIFWNNFSLQSAVFKHSLRVSIACVAGYILSKSISNAHHSYWILMTITFMLKPAFSLTKQRNIQRVKGTLLGGALGVLILLFVPNHDVQFALMILFMLGTYSFTRINYLIGVVCTTPYVLILFNLLGAEFSKLAEERVLDTVIGCAIALIASYFLFPQWESSQLKSFMQQMVKANIGYLQQIEKALNGQTINMLEYKLSRKDVYVSSANLSSAFQRMLTEPKKKQTSDKDVHQFVVLNLILLSNIATVATSLILNKSKEHPYELTRITEKALGYLQDSLYRLNSDMPFEGNKIELKKNLLPVTGNPEEELMKEQLNFICKISKDIDRTTMALVIHKPLNG